MLFCRVAAHYATKRPSHEVGTVTASPPLEPERRESTVGAAQGDVAVTEGCLRSLSLGNVHIAIDSTDDAWLEQVTLRYGGFLAPLAPGSKVIHLVFHVRDGPELSPEALRDARLHGLWPHGGAEHPLAATVELRGDGFHAHWRRAQRRIEVWGPRAVYPLDLLLQALWYACHPHALIVHAAALSDGSSGWLCPGPSGCGKSTLAALLPERALADELVGVWLHGGQAEMVALPFWTARPGRVGLRAIHCLRHRQTVETTDEAPHMRRPMGTAEALQSLRGQIAWPTWDTAAMARSLETLARLLETVPVYELAFSPTPSVWSSLSRAEEVVA